jgi:hypothetical protein
MRLDGEEREVFARIRATLEERLPESEGWRWYHGCWWRLRHFEENIWYGVIAGFVGDDETVLAAVAEDDPEFGMMCRPADWDLSPRPLSRIDDAVAEAHAAARQAVAGRNP